jgi:hypothetical protein
MHSPKVPQLDFSVQVERHNLKIFLLWKTSGGNAPELGERIRVRPSVPILHHISVFFSYDIALSTCFASA